MNDRFGSLPYIALALMTVAASTAACESAEVESSTRASTLTNQPSLHIDLSQTSASGLSSGAFMAVQLNVAFSSIMRGVAVFAGGPFTCSQGSVASALTRCMSSSSKMDPAPYVASTQQYAAEGAIDPIAGLAAQRVFLFGGETDHTIDAAVVDGVRDYYAALGVPAGQIRYERKRPATGHTMPTLAYGGSCAASAGPYLGNCGYDGAGKALEQIYGPLEPRVEKPTGKLVSIAQNELIDSPSTHSLADTAWAYVPTSCANGETCRVHVAFHGCLQSASKVGDAFYAHAGYNEWADDNHLVILYPQAIAKPGANPNGCWDWWGYDGADYAKKTGPQMKMVRAMLAHIAGGVSPADAGVGDATSEAAVVSDPVEVDAGAPPAPECFAATNAEHVAAGRAYAAYGFAFARGSNQALGLASAWVRTGLERAAPDVWVLGACW